MAEEAKESTQGESDMALGDYFFEPVKTRDGAS